MAEKRDYLKISRVVAKASRRCVARHALSLALLLAILCGAWPGRAQSAASLDDLFRLFQVALPLADVALMLDASLSMRGQKYSGARRAMIEFAPALTDKENLHLRLFGDTVTNPLEGRGDEAAGQVESYLPAEPFFNFTDLGLAISKGLEFLERDGAGQAQAFFLLTDGWHEPLPDSPYSRDFANDPDWQALRQRAEALSRRRQLFVYGFGLGQQTDIGVLRRVFPARNVEVVVGDTAQVAYALRRVRELLRRTQLRQAVARELEEGRVEARLAQSNVSGSRATFDVPLTIRNGYGHLPVRVEQINIQRSRGASPEIECALADAPSGLVLEAGAQWEGLVKCALQAEAPGWRIGEAAREYRATWEFAPVARFQHEAALEELGLNPTPANAGHPALAVDLRVPYGLPYWPFILLVALAAAAIGIGKAKRRQAERDRAAAEQRQAERRRLAGQLKIWPARQEEPEGDGLDLSHYASERLDLMAGEEGDLTIVVPEEFSAEQTAAAQAAFAQAAVPPAGEVVAHLSGHLIEAKPDDGESGRLEFRIEAAAGHKLAYESGDEMRETGALVLYDNDSLTLDGRWQLRYVNRQLRLRAEVEAAQLGEVFYVEQQ